MASNPKRPNLQLDTPENTEESSSSFASEGSGENDAPRVAGENRNGRQAGRPSSHTASDADTDEDEEAEEVLGTHQLSPAEREIQVDFEARSPQECDFHGIVNLLRQMMRSTISGGHTSSVNISDLADHIIAQRSVGSVITQSLDDMDDEDDSDIEEQENNAGGANRANGGNNATGSNDVLEPNNEVIASSHFSKVRTLNTLCT